MDKFFSVNEIDTQTIVLDTGADDYYNDKHCDERKKPTLVKKDAECCFEMPEKIIFDKCQDKKEKTIGPVRLKCQARLLRLNVVLKNVCKGRKIAIGVLVIEDKKTKAFKGTEIMVPGERGKGCVDIKINNFCFVLPEKSICDKRKVEAKVIAHYIDFGKKDDCIY